MSAESRLFLFFFGVVWVLQRLGLDGEVNRASGFCGNGQLIVLVEGVSTLPTCSQWPVAIN